MRWRDTALFWGPVPAGLGVVELHAFREHWIEKECQRYEEPPPLTLPLREEKYRLDWEAVRGSEEVVLWFGPDVGDQLALLQCLAGLAGQPVRVTLVTLERHAPLSAGPYGDLFENRRQVTDDETQIAVEMWNLYRDPSPVGFAERAPLTGSAFPQLPAAAESLPKLFPQEGTGLDEIEHTLLTCFRNGPKKAVGAVAESLSHFGDGMVISRLWDLLHGVTPLLRCVDGSVAPRHPALMKQRIQLTEAGKAALAGRFNVIEMNGIDRHVGGCHLQSPHAVYVWSARQLGFRLL